MDAVAMNETFSIQFSGEAFDGYEIPASALAQSLLALDGLARRSAEAAYGKGVEAEIKVKAGFKRGSFIMDLVAYCNSNPIEIGVAAGIVTISGPVFNTIKSLITSARFALGKKLDLDGTANEKGEVKVINCAGQVNYFDAKVVNIYNQERTRSNLSRLTQTLDTEGADSIRLFQGESENESEEIITKQDREYLRQVEGVVLTDNESDVILDVICPMMNGSPKGWRFSDGDVEFSANVEDEEYLEMVKNGTLKFKNGTAIRAILRTVQRKTIRKVTERTIVEVKETIDPTDE